MVLYGIVATLFSYCITLFMSSPLSSFAVSAGYQVLMFLVRTDFSCFIELAFTSAIIAVYCRIPTDIHVRSVIESRWYNHNYP
jgi:hypothetical protein